MVINHDDNVATVIGTAESGDELTVTGETDIKSIAVASDVPFGHKVAITNISPHDKIIKYGYSIGTATDNITTGDHVHVHNMESDRGHGERTAKEQ